MSTRFPPASPSPLTHTQSILIYSYWDHLKGPPRGSRFLSTPPHQSHTAHNQQKKLSKLVLLTCHPTMPRNLYDFLVSSLLNQAPIPPHPQPYQPVLLKFNYLGHSFGPASLKCLPHIPNTQTFPHPGCLAVLENMSVLTSASAFCLGLKTLLTYPPAHQKPSPPSTSPSTSSSLPPTVQTNLPYS